MCDGGGPVLQVAARADPVPRLPFAVTEVPVIEEICGVAFGHEPLGKGW